MLVVSRGVALSHAECEFCLTQRTQNAQRHASFLLRVASGVLVFLTTDCTDYTDASLAECEFCLTQRPQNAQRHASFLLRVASGVLVFLTTDYTDKQVKQKTNSAVSTIRRLKNTIRI